MERVTVTVKACIKARDKGIRYLAEEYRTFKKCLTRKVQKAVRKVVKDREIKVYAQQKWMLDEKLTRYIKNLPHVVRK